MPALSSSNSDCSSERRLAVHVMNVIRLVICIIRVRGALLFRVGTCLALVGKRLYGI